MPKKFKGENSKAVVAKARKAEKAAADKVQKEKAVEDAYWKEDDKLICKKVQRKEEKERKKLEDAQRKEEKRLLEERENLEITPKVIPPKVTLHQLQIRKEDNKKLLKNEQKEEFFTETPLEENLNRLEGETITASGIDAAVAALSVSENPVDLHPERRMAAAFRAYEADRLPTLKKENANMRHSQLKQLLRKEWQKSPQNPLNRQLTLAKTREDFPGDLPPDFKEDFQEDFPEENRLRSSIMTHLPTPDYV